MLSDPYSPGRIPSVLAGRGDELSVARGALGPVSLGRAAGPLVAFYGARGVGKTSLLRAVQREAAEATFLTAWVTGRPDERLIVGLANSLAQALRDAHLESRSRVLAQRIEKVRVEVGVPGAKVGAELRTGGDDVPPTLEALLEDAARFARSHARPGLVVFVDELQDAPLEDRRSLLIALQHLDGALQGCPVAVLAAGLPSLPAAVTDAATFGERSTFVPVGALGAVAVAEALRLPAAAASVAWSDEAVDACVEESRGYAYKVQLLGSAAWAAAGPRAAGDQVLLPHVRRAVDDVDRQMRTMFAARLAKTNGEERRLLRALAEVVDDDGVASRGAAASTLGVPSTALSRPRQALIDKGLLEVADRGTLRFTIPGFDRYLKEHVEDD